MKKAILLIMVISVFATAFAGCSKPVDESPVGATAEEEMQTPENNIAEESTAKPSEEPVQREWLDIAYADQSEAQKLDVFLPQTGEGPFPVIISIHGGAWKGGDKIARTANRGGLDRGYAEVRVNYRLSSEAIFPAAVYDVKAAVRFIKANAEKYNVDPERIVAWGDSAGGYLAVMLGVTSDIAELEDLSMGNPDQTSVVQAVVDFFAPVNFTTLNADAVEGGVIDYDYGEAGSDESKFLGGSYEEIPEIFEQASASSYISADDPPFFIEHGKADIIIPFHQSIHFAEELGSVIGEDNVSLVLLDEAGHGTDEFTSEENLDIIFDFLDQYLK